MLSELPFAIHHPEMKGCKSFASLPTKFFAIALYRCKCAYSKKVVISESVICMEFSLQQLRPRANINKHLEKLLNPKQNNISYCALKSLVSIVLG